MENTQEATAQGGVATTFRTMKLIIEKFDTLTQADKVYVINKLQEKTEATN